MAQAPNGVRPRRPRQPPYVPNPILTQAEADLINTIYQAENQQILADIKNCNYHKLRGEFTKERSKFMEGVLQLPLPPPPRPGGQRMKKHYTEDEVFNAMVARVEAMPALASSNIDRMITKFIYASNVYPPAPQ
jgi:hypothetical protein